MSGIVGVLHLNGGPVEQRMLLGMNELGRHRGPDGTGFFVNAPVGLAYTHLETGNDNACSDQPLALRGYHFVVDGRIDNRSELRSALVSAGHIIEKVTDAELIVMAYEQWGTECANRIIGEFAFALWDPKEQTLFCARDALGVRPLHYYHDSKVFIFASEIRQLLGHPLVSAEPNEAMIAEYACHRVTSRSETLYRNIFRLPAGHFLSVGPTSFKKQQYWNFRCGAHSPFKSDAECTEEFLRIFSEAVRCRTADRCHVGFELSGGLDSSSIVCIANRLAGDRARFQMFSIEGEGGRADETTFIRDVAAATGINSFLFKAIDLDATRMQDLVRQIRDFPGAATLLMLDPLMRGFKERNVPVRITGIGGDQWLMGDVRHIADMMRRLKFWSAIRQAYLDTKVVSDFAFGDGFPALNLLARFGIAPLMPPFLRRVSKRLLRQGPIPSWIEPQFAKRINLAERLNYENAETAKSKFPTIVQRQMWREANSGWFGLVLEMSERYGFSFGVETRHPFCDRRVVEFCLSMPEEQRWRGQETRFVLRSAMKGILPESVRTRITKGDYTEILTAHLLQPEVRNIIEESVLASLGFLNQAALSKIYSQFRSDYEKGANYPRFELQLTMIHGIESWARFAFS